MRWGALCPPPCTENMHAGRGEVRPHTFARPPRACTQHTQSRSWSSARRAKRAAGRATLCCHSRRAAALCCWRDACMEKGQAGRRPGPGRASKKFRHRLAAQSLPGAAPAPAAQQRRRPRRGGRRSTPQTMKRARQCKYGRALKAALGTGAAPAAAQGCSPIVWGLGGRTLGGEVLGERKRGCGCGGTTCLKVWSQFNAKYTKG